MVRVVVYMVEFLKPRFRDLWEEPILRRQDIKMHITTYTDRFSKTT